MRYIIALFVLCLYVPSALALCYIQDVACLAPRVLPEYNSDRSSTREWSAPNGITFGYGNRIITRVRFDNEAVGILRSNSDFGIEIEAVLEGPNKDIELDRIETTFPSNAKAGIDTALSDFFTNDPNSRNVAVHVLNPSAIEPGVDYFVFYIFKNLLPSSGVTVVSNLQITLDLGDKFSYGYGLFVTNLYAESVPYLDQFQYFLLETDPHVPFVAYPSGNSSGFPGVCWTSKTASATCWIVLQNQCTGLVNPPEESIWARVALRFLGIADAYADTSVCSLPSSGTTAPVRSEQIHDTSNPPPVSGSDGSTDLPNLTMRDVYLLDANKDKVPSIHVNKNFYCHMNVKNYGEKKANGVFENRCWVSKGNKFDGKNDAEDIGKDDMDDLDNGYSRSSDEDSTGIKWPGTYNLVGCTDASGKVTESNEKDNCNVGDHAVIHEFVFQVVSDPNLTTTAINLGGKTSLSIKESFVISSTTANPGENFGPDYVYIGYFIDGAFVGKNQILRANMQGGMNKTEETSVPAGIAVPGIHEVKACADYDNHIAETNETDNCMVFLVTVSDPNAPPPNPDPNPNPTPPPPMSKSEEDELYLMLLLD
ncbi:MAG: hypothetical protein IPJ67_05240 [Candidatus Moraniibacteriota bacterium]|nr:MAG: hypothetical protein IPJ67_05240 [Candidatus Moranbacteria bacterium]